VYTYVVYYKSKVRDKETLGSAGKHTVNLVLVVTKEETSGLVRRSRNQVKFICKINQVVVYYESMKRKLI
jgi:hypothetical protein